MIKKFDIVIGKITSFNDDGVFVFITNLKVEGFCTWKNISDFPENWEKFKAINSVYKFYNSGFCSQLNKLKLSYKFIHPEEIRIKKQTIPTATHFYSIHKYILNKLEEKPEPMKDMPKFRDLCNNIVSD